MHLKENAQKAIFGNYNPEQVYEEIVFDDTYQTQFSANINSFNKAKADLIIHAGDIGNQKIIDILEGASNLIAVNGNCDFNAYKTINGFTKDFEIFNYEDVSIALAHTPYDLEQWTNNKNFMLYIHGHTHEPYIKKKKNGSVWLCPGSASIGRYGSPDSIATIYLSDSKVIAAQLIKV